MGKAQAGLRKAIAFVSMLALAMPPVAVLARGPVEKSVATPVTNVTAEQLERLPLNRDMQGILDLHNRLRSEIGSPPLKWNGASAARAAQWAQRLADTGQLEHSPRSSRPSNERENLALGNSGVTSVVNLMQTWAAEKRFIDVEKLIAGAPFPSMCTGEWTQCAHLTQILWSTTTDVGCGFARGARFDALVCRYSPPGNSDGKPGFVRAPLININNSPPVQVAAAESPKPLEDILADIGGDRCREPERYGFIDILLNDPDVDLFAFGRGHSVALGLTSVPISSPLLGESLDPDTSLPVYTRLNRPYASSFDETVFCMQANLYY